MRSLVLALTVLNVSADPQPGKDTDPQRFARWEKEVAAIEKRLAADPPKPGCVIFAGSSSVRLWDLKKSFPGAGYVNVGFGGSQIPDCTHFAGRLIAPHKPRAVVLYAGDNDIAAGRPPEQVLADFQAFCAAVHASAPKCRVLFVAVKPSVLRWKQFDTQKKANALVRDSCRTDDRLAFVDVVPVMLGADGMPVASLYAKDGLHLSPEGYEKWTAVVRGALSEK
jgi:lysophospholipase L1-like esterase